MATKHTKKKMSTKKKLAAATAVVLSAALLAGGAFAFQDFTQSATNRLLTNTSGSVILHDDFDNVPDSYDDYGNAILNKDVYVENMGEQDLVVRVRFDEEFQVGNRLLVGASVTDKTTWDTLEFPNATTLAADGLVAGHRKQTDPILPYYEWYMTGEWKHYKPGTGSSGDNVYSHLQAFDDGTEAQHTANPAPVITMATYTAKPDLYTGEGIDGRWVLDTDGWAYWSQPLPGGKATNLLLDSVKKIGLPDDNSQYNINVVLQATSFGDAGLFITYPDTATPDGKDLIDRITNETVEPLAPEGFRFAGSSFIIGTSTSKDISASINGVPVTADSGVTFTIVENEGETPVDPITQIEISGITVTTVDAPERQFTIRANFSPDVEGTKDLATQYPNGVMLLGSIKDVGDGEFATENVSPLLSLQLDGNRDGLIDAGELSSVVTLDLSSLTSGPIVDTDLLGLGEVLPSLNNLTGIDLSGLDGAGEGVQDLLTALLDGKPNSQIKVLNLSDASNVDGLGGLLGNLTNLLELDLSGAEFDGDSELTGFLGNLANPALLQTLNLSGATGLLEPVLSALTGLLNLDLSGITSSLTPDLSGLGKLLSLDLSNSTGLSGNFGDIIASLPVKGLLQSLNLSGIGDISGLNLTGLTGLLNLDLSNNLLSGILGGTGDILNGAISGLADLTNLKSLDVSGNSGITGILIGDDGDGLLSSLTNLDASGLSQLLTLNAPNTGLINLDLLDSTGLLGLNLSGTDIIRLADIGGLGKLLNLKNLDLSGGALTGPLNFPSLPSLVELLVNNLKGVTGLDVSQLSALKSLNLTGLTEIAPKALNLLGSGLIKSTDDIAAILSNPLVLLNPPTIEDILAEDVTMDDIEGLDGNQGLINNLLGGVLNTVGSLLGGLGSVVQSLLKTLGLA